MFNQHIKQWSINKIAVSENRVFSKAFPWRFRIRTWPRSQKQNVEATQTSHILTLNPLLLLFIFIPYNKLTSGSNTFVSCTVTCPADSQTVVCHFSPIRGPTKPGSRFRLTPRLYPDLRCACARWKAKFLAPFGMDEKQLINQLPARTSFI